MTNDKRNQPDFFNLYEPVRLMKRTNQKKNPNHFLQNQNVQGNPEQSIESKVQDHVSNIFFRLSKKHRVVFPMKPRLYKREAANFQGNPEGIVDSKIQDPVLDYVYQWWRPLRG